MQQARAGDTAVNEMDVVHVGDRKIVPKDVHVLIPETVTI